MKPEKKITMLGWAMGYTRSVAADPTGIYHAIVDRGDGRGVPLCSARRYHSGQVEAKLPERACNTCLRAMAKWQLGVLS